MTDAPDWLRGWCKIFRQIKNNGNRPEGRENAEDQVTIGLSFAPDWLNGWHEFFKRITNIGNRLEGRKRGRPSHDCVFD